MKMPEVLNGQSLSVRVRLQPIEMSISLKVEDLSTATIKLDSTAPDVDLGEWIRITAPNGEMFVGYVKTKNTDYVTGHITLNVEHTFGLLDEMVMFGEYDAQAMGGSNNKVSASAAIQFALNKQTTRIWSFGTCAFSDTQGWKFTNSTIRSALTDVFEAIADAQWEFDQTVYPFTVSLKHQPQQATMEMRKNRNLSSMKVTLDRSQMFTRVYPIGNKNLHIDGEYIDRNTSQWGVIAQTITDSSIKDKDLLRSWANAQLKRNADPVISVSINCIELSESTGESMDHFRIGRLCRVPLPDYGTTVTQRMVELSWRNAIADPLNATASLASEHKTIQGVLNEQARGGSGGKKSKHQEGCDLEDDSEAIYEFENSDIWINRDNVWAVSAQYDVFTDGEGRHVRLKSGALLEVEREAGIYQTVGDIIGDQDQSIQNLDSWVDSFEGSALWTQRDNITGVCGEYDIEYYTDSSGHRKKRLKIKNGTGLVMERNGATFGVYDSGNLTAGVMIQRLNDGSTNLKLKADRIDIDGLVTELQAKTILCYGVEGSTGTFYDYCYAGKGFQTLYGDMKVLDITKSGDTLTITKLVSGTKETITFNKAVTLNGVWSDGTYTVTPSSGNPISTSLYQLTNAGSVIVSGTNVSQNIRVDYANSTGDGGISTGFIFPVTISAAGVYPNSVSLTRYRAGPVEGAIPGQMYRKNSNGTYTALGTSSTYWYAANSVDLGSTKTVHYS